MFMTETEIGLLAAIRANPQDAGARLIYSDLLLELGRDLEAEAVRRLVEFRKKDWYDRRNGDAGLLLGVVLVRAEECNGALVFESTLGDVFTFDHDQD